MEGGWRRKKKAAERDFIRTGVAFAKRVAGLQPSPPHHHHQRTLQAVATSSVHKDASGASKETNAIEKVLDLVLVCGMRP